MQRLNIILPVLNEERCLEASVRKIKAFLDSQNIPYMLTIADNGSTDNTSTIARALCNTHTQYLKISQKGVGIAFRESILHNAAHEQPCEFVGYMDIDLSTNLAHLKEVYALLCQGEKIVVGSRLLRDSVVSGRSIKREITSRGLNHLLRFVLGVRFSDAMCGFKFYEAKSAQYLLTQCYEDNGWFYCAQMLILAQYRDIKICEIPVVWQDDKESKVKITRLSLNYLKEILRLFARRVRGKL